jgi:hypothetical protein
MVFQVKAFLALLEILFGNKSIVTKKIREFVQLIEQNSIYYKECLCNNKLFPTKVLWTVCWHFQLFLACCQKADKREEVDNSLLDFAPNHRDIMMGHFIPTLPLLFKVVDTKEKETNNDNTNDKRTTKKRKRDKKKEKRKKLMAESVGIVTNKQQCTDFKLNPNEKWEQFPGKKLDQWAKLNDTAMCARWHTRGNCFKDCKNRANQHVACSEILLEAKQTHIKCLAAVRHSE